MVHHTPDQLAETLAVGSILSLRCVRHFAVFSVVSFSIVLQIGCSERDEIRRYAVARQPAVKTKQRVEPAAGDNRLRPAGDRPPSVISYDTPQGWTQGNVSGMRKAAFDVQDGEQKVKITVINLAVAAGTLLPNVNRWRGQIGLNEITQQELDRETNELQVGSVQGDYVQLVGPADAQQRETILGVVLIDAGYAWFFKLRGDSQLAERETERFEAFVRSVKFSNADGADGGNE